MRFMYLCMHNYSFPRIIYVNNVNKGMQLYGRMYGVSQKLYIIIHTNMPCLIIIHRLFYTVIVITIPIFALAYKYIHN